MKLIYQTLAVAAVFAVCLFVSPSLNAQLHVESSGEVGIGTTAPSAKLDIYNTSTKGLENYTYYNGSSSTYGIDNYISSASTGTKYGYRSRTYGNSGSTSNLYGLYNYSYSYSNYSYGAYNYCLANGGNGTKYGLYTRLFCSTGDGTGSRYALYASNGCSGGYAGYFAGNVYVSGTITSASDLATKRNVAELNGALSLVSQLQPKTYDYKIEEHNSLPEGKQYGLIAQDLEVVIPELVQEVELFDESDEVDDSGNVAEPTSKGTIKTVNYIGLIPVLVKATQEQQELIEEQRAQIEQQQQQIDQLMQMVNDR